MAATIAGTGAAGTSGAEAGETEAVPVVELSREDGLRIIDRQARRYLKMSGAEFIRRWNAGEFRDDPDRPGVARLAMLLPLAA